MLVTTTEGGEKVAKVTDFGTSKMTSLRKQNELSLTNNVGTPA